MTTASPMALNLVISMGMAYQNERSISPFPVTRSPTEVSAVFTFFSFTIVACLPCFGCARQTGRTPGRVQSVIGIPFLLLATLIIKMLRVYAIFVNPFSYKQKFFSNPLLFLYILLLLLPNTLTLIVWSTFDTYRNVVRKVKALVAFVSLKFLYLILEVLRAKTDKAIMRM